MTLPPSQQSVPLPDLARQRLASSRAGVPVFTSDLTVNEFVLTTQAGFTPLGLVMGTAVYHIGVQVSRWGKNMELTTLTQAMYHARELAMARMEAEADALGADGIIGVRLEFRTYAFSSDILEFIAIGTAVTATDKGTWRTPGGRPFTSDLSGQDFWTLVQHGWLPVSLVLGTCVYHIAHQTFRQTLSQLGQNAEMVNFSQGIYDARELAMARMQYEAQQVGAHGVVGVGVTESPWIWGEHATEFFCIGTAVRRHAPDVEAVRPTMVLPLTP